MRRAARSPPGTSPTSARIADLRAMETIVSERCGHAIRGSTNPAR
jgi:hypothetical protein